MAAVANRPEQRNFRHRYAQKRYRETGRANKRLCLVDRENWREHFEPHLCLPRLGNDLHLMCLQPSYKEFLCKVFVRCQTEKLNAYARPIQPLSIKSVETTLQGTHEQLLLDARP